MNVTVDNESDLGNVASELLESIQSKKIVLFRGDLGAGKTTLIKQICTKLGVLGSMSSPSFSIINEYDAKSSTVYHVDLYRIKDIQEIYEFGLYEVLDSGNICLIEWPEMAEEIWHEYDVLEVNITADKTGARRIFVK